MRKPITTQEAERIVCNGGKVFRGVLKYQVICGQLNQIDRHCGHEIDWFQFNHMSNFEVEVPEEDKTIGDLPKLPDGCTWLREGSVVHGIRQTAPLGDTYYTAIICRERRDIYAALVQLWDQEHTST